MKDSSDSEIDSFTFVFVVAHWFAGLVCLVLGGLSWKFIVAGAACWVFCGFMVVAISVDNDL